MKKIDYNLKKELPLILMIIAAFAISIYFYPMLPDRIPTHWNFKGEIDGYSGKLSGAYMLPVMNLAMYGLFIILPSIDPRRENYKLFSSTYIYFRYLFHIYFLGMHVIVIAAALGYNVDTGRLVMLAVSLLFMLMGNVMGRVKHNYFVGIKTPWTLASEEVWKKTHRLAALLWTIAGFLGAVFALLRVNLGWIFIIILMVPALVPVIYSYIIFNKMRKTGS
ncbi:SdpI family protein [Lutispora sp.]|uniref:SdpI family protein n=1 Tax=Lutispora sp. TaxID=2828727 RepID=UPI00356886C1